MTRCDLSPKDVVPQSTLRARTEDEADKRTQAEKRKAGETAEGVGT